MVCTAITLAFFGFLRYADLAKLQVDWVLVFSHHLDLFLEERKTDQFRLGQWLVVCAWPNSHACPVTLVRRLLERARLAGHRPLFSKLTAAGDAYADTKPIPYATLRTLFLEKFEAIGLDTSKFGTHSCRAGGATLAANNGVADKLWMEHGGWRSARVAQGYVKTAHSLKASVTQAMTGTAPAARVAPPSSAICRELAREWRHQAVGHNWAPRQSPRLPARCHRQCTGQAHTAGSWPGPASSIRQHAHLAGRRIRRAIVAGPGRHFLTARL